MDRRVIRRRRTQLKEQLEALKKQRSIQKKRRVRNEMPTATLIGYTNAGKSTIFNAIAQADVYVQNQLFATLDATTRRIEAENGQPYLLSDTVGFISHLPTELIEAFQSTLEEAVDADLLLIVSDASNPEALTQRRVVKETLERLGADRKPCLEILNKCDAALPETLNAFPDAVKTSALTGDGMDALKQEISRRLSSQTVIVRFEVPYQSMQLVSLIHDAGQNVEAEYRDDAVLVTACLDHTALQRILKSGGADLHFELVTPEKEE